MTDAPNPEQPRHVRIDAQAGRASIVVDGTDVSRGVRAYSLQHSVEDMLPSLVLHTVQTNGVQWEGLARVAVGVQQSPGEIVAAFLSGVDPVLLDQEALNRSDYGSGRGATARAMLATLIEWARQAGEGVQDARP